MNKKAFEIDTFNRWNIVKQKLHLLNNIPLITEGEMWWCAVGKNIGVEIMGKNVAFSRPVIIFKKLDRYSFMAIPVSTKQKSGSWYVPFIFKNKNEVAVLSQIKIMSASRLYDKMGELDDADFLKIKDGFKKLYVE